MKGVLPRLRLAGLGLPLLLTGCASGVLPGSDATDPSCVLLCALTREVMGEPTPPPKPQPVVSAAKPAKPAVQPVAHVAAKPRPVEKPRETAALAPHRVIAQVHRRPVRRRPEAQVSVVPQAPAKEAAPKPAAMVPSAPAPMAVAPPPAAPAEPPRSLTQSIPGSVGIMPQGWREP